jgi:hypothetical protein
MTVRVKTCLPHCKRLRGDAVQIWLAHDPPRRMCGQRKCIVFAGTKARMLRLNTAGRKINMTGCRRLQPVIFASGAPRIMPFSSDEGHFHDIFYLNASYRGRSKRGRPLLACGRKRRSHVKHSHHRMRFGRPRACSSLAVRLLRKLLVRFSRVSTTAAVRSTSSLKMLPARIMRACSP